MTVEATLSLTIFLFFMMFFMNFGHIYQAQNYITHGVLQTGKSLAFYSFEYEQKSPSDFIQELFGLGSGKQIAIEQKWNAGSYASAAREMFSYCAGVEPAQTDAVLKKYGLVNGIESLDFSNTSVKDNKLFLKVQYDIQLPFAFLGLDKVTMHQQTICGLWETEE